jgi:hypothetical protein
MTQTLKQMTLVYLLRTVATLIWLKQQLLLINLRNSKDKRSLSFLQHKSYNLLAQNKLFFLKLNSKLLTKEQIQLVM